MKKNTIVFLIALCPLIPAASRFSYGLVLCFALIWLFVSGVIFRELIKLIVPGESWLFFELVCLGGSASVFFLVLQGFYPILSLSLDIYIYFIAFSLVLVTSIERFSTSSQSFIPILYFCPMLLLFSVLREILGFGTISVPVASGFIEFSVLPYFEKYGLGFWGTNGGALILIGIFAWIVMVLNKKTFDKMDKRHE